MEVPAEEENAPPRKVTFTRHTYTVSYAGDAYFADHVFHLTDKQKKTADSYVENLTMFFGGSASGLAMAVGVSDEVLAYRAPSSRSHRNTAWKLMWNSSWQS